jgi:hypothetical protein
VTRCKQRIPLRSGRATRRPGFRFGLFVTCAGSDALSFRLETHEPTSAIHLLLFQRRATRGLAINVSAEAATNPAPFSARSEEHSPTSPSRWSIARRTQQPVLHVKT